jgi:catechol 2,3-dioxygenase-like lactoylglutathione lyase family enzyme
MSIIGIDHIQLAMPAGQEERARKFYRDVLGLPETPKPPDLAKRGGCWFETDHIKIHLGVDKDFHPATKAHPGLLVSDLQAIVERCRQRGFEIVNDAPLEGYQRVYVNDPFGNRLELMQKV